VYLGGRLGLGPTPQVTTHSRNIANKKKLAMYQLRPKYIPGLFGAINVSCGEVINADIFERVYL
jgi:hypothetical protein